MVSKLAQVEKVRVHLQTLTPLHIGGSEGSLSPLQFAHCDGKVYVISPQKWADLLRRNKSVESFITYVKDKGKYAKLREYLTSEGRDWLKPELLAPLAKYTVESASAPTGDLRPFIRNGYQQPYIPGSAIKGALRLAALYVLCTKLDPAKKEELLDKHVKVQLERFREDLARARSYKQQRLKENYKRSFTEKIDRELLRDFKISDYWAKTDAHSDIFRVIEVRDSEPFKPDMVEVEEIKVHSVGAGVKDYSIFAECLQPGAEFTIDLKIDLDLLDAFKRNNGETNYRLDFQEIESLMHDPFSAANALAQKLYADEQTFLQQELEVAGALNFARQPGDRLVRLGWGGGMLATTLDLLLDKPLRRDIRNLLFVDKGQALAPKTRRLTTGNQPLGWCKIVCQEVL